MTSDWTRHVALFLSLAATACGGPRGVSDASGAALSGDAPPHASGDGPIVLTLRSLGSPDAKVIASGAGGKRLYFGAQSHDRQRHNLVVAKLDGDGNLLGVNRYADSDAPLPDDKSLGSVQSILVDERSRHLYLGTASAPMANTSTRGLSVYDLDAEGDPVGAPKSYDVGAPNGGWCLARHPRLSLLYMGGWPGAEIRVFDLSPNGEPQGRFRSYPFGGNPRASALAVSADGAHLYIGSHPGLLEVANLDASGAPAGKPRIFPVSADSRDYLQFAYTPRAVFIAQQGPGMGSLAMWPLDATGAPSGAPRILSDVPAKSALLTADGARLIVAGESRSPDAMTQEVLVDGFRSGTLPLPLEGTPTNSSSALQATPGMTAVLVAEGPRGRAVVVTTPLAKTINRVRGYKLRAEVASVEPTPKAGIANLSLGKLPNRQIPTLGQVPIGQFTAWVGVDDVLKDQSSPVMLTINVAGAPKEIDVVVEVEPSTDGGGRPIALRRTVTGGSLAFYLPGYKMLTEHDRVAAVELLATRANTYLAWSRAAALPAADRPKRYVLSAYQMMGEGDLAQLHATVETIASLGLNTVDAYNWGALPPSTIAGALRAGGLDRRSMAVYAPPSSFAFADDMTPVALDAWASKLWAAQLPKGTSAPEVAIAHLSDEPGWYYPAVVHGAQTPGALAAFRDYLRGTAGLNPADVGKLAWDQVVPSSASTARDLPSKRLFYWTTRFVSHEGALGLLHAREALERQLGRKLIAPVNWNNGNRFYIPSPNKKYANNADVGPDAAYGSHDWFEAGRMKACTPWSEDWYGDSLAEKSSFTGELLRSAASLGGEEFGAYVVGRTLGDVPGGSRYKVMSLVGHGAKLLSFYTWGPLGLFGDSWSDRQVTYGAVADAVRMIGRAEKLLYPGRPRRGSVAILVPGASLPWELDSAERHYTQELLSLHYALAHSGYPVDFVDETDLVGGALAERHYASLYVTEPDVPKRALGAIASWVEQGGTLVLTTGAGTNDEYDVPAADLDPVLGLEARGTARPPTEQAPYPSPAHRLTKVDPSLGFAPFPLYGSVTPLQPKTATVLATLETGQAAITSNAYGKGRAIALGFFPGWQYWTTQKDADDRLPTGWGAEQRHAATLGARLAGAARQVVMDREIVEGCRLDSSEGVAVVLLNWTGTPLDSIHVTVPGAKAFTHVSSVEHGKLEAKVSGDDVEVQLPLKDVDVLMLQ